MNGRFVGEVEVYPIGLGCMPLSNPNMVTQRPQAIATIHAALDAGITLLDSADIYAPDAASFGHNEQLIGEALRTWDASSADRDRVVVATKGGITRTVGPDGDLWGRGGRPEQLLAAAQASATRLGVDVIDLYFFHRFDPDVALNDQLAGLGAVRDAGLARRIGLSNVTLAQLDRAIELLGGPAQGGVVAVQNEYSPSYRRDSDVLDRCQEAGIAFLPWSPLGGVAQAGELGSRYEPFARIAQARGVAPQQVALAWLLAQSEVVIPIPGSSRPETARSSAAAADLQLAAGELAELNATVAEDASVFPDDTPAPAM